jgi:alkanesulfonate monooxygenase SsuD/methylene tetrahydromethanopterin reductase-like flavin-dependent oxidoreductase (luciferase family)
MSGGRVELGLGAGWYEAEHTAYGFGFPDVAARFDSLEDQLAIITGLWSTAVGETFTYAGKVHSVRDSPALPKPVQRPLPIVMGGGGKRKTPRLAAQHATEFNMPFTQLDTFVAQCDRVRSACAAIGRERAPVFSAALVLCAGGDEPEVVRRAAAIGRRPDELRKNGAAGTAEEVAATLRTWRDAGAERIYLQVLDVGDLEHLDFVATEVVPLLA